MYDVHDAAQTMSKLDGKKHPVLFLCNTSWAGVVNEAYMEVILHLLKDRPCVDSQEEGNGNGGLLYISQRDRKEANYLVTKASRDHFLFKAFQSGELRILGTSPHVVPEALKKLRGETGTDARVREETGAFITLDAACMVDEKLGQATLPDSARLHFHVSDELKKRMLAFEKEFGPLAKRRKADPSSSPDLRFPGKLKRTELASKDFEIAQAGKIKIATKSTTRQFVENDKL